MGYSQFVKFRARITKLGTSQRYEKGITAICKKLNWVAYCAAGHVHVICTSIHAFKTTGQTFGRIELKLGGSLGTINGNMSFI